MSRMSMFSIIIPDLNAELLEPGANKDKVYSGNDGQASIGIKRKG